ncbi:MAG: hypothetical protein JSV99_11160 [Planctomycetota bacterium]|nr:MAG: hypothetical protein JSV99_11160 [Planctomycetota bacterium]
MVKATARILRADSVKIEGRLSLQLTQTHPQPPRARDAASVQPQVRILENHPDFAVIEITCSCGTKTNLRCEYGAAESPPEAPQTQSGTPPADANSPNAPKTVPPADTVKEQTK